MITMCDFFWLQKQLYINWQKKKNETFIGLVLQLQRFTEITMNSIGQSFFLPVYPQSETGE